MKSLRLETYKQQGATMHHLDTCLTTLLSLASLHPASLTLTLSHTHCGGQVEDSLFFNQWAVKYCSAKLQMRKRLVGGKKRHW